MNRRELFFGSTFFAVSSLAWGSSKQQENLLQDSAYKAGRPSLKQLQAIRKLKFSWITMFENGGPAVDVFKPYGTMRLADALSPIIGSSNPGDIKAFHASVCGALIWALKNGKLPVGIYDIAPLTSTVMREHITGELSNLPADRLGDILKELPTLKDDRYFTITSEHQLLLSSINFEWEEPEGMDDYDAFDWKPVPSVDFKRPFGDATDFISEIAAILSQPEPKNPAAQSKFSRMYWEMWPALQAFVLYAEIPTSS